MNCIEIEKTKIFDKEITDIGIDLLMDGRLLSDCRAYILSEFCVDADDLEALLANAARRVEEWQAEVGRQLWF